jgi:hypothetical protein
MQKSSEATGYNVIQKKSFLIILSHESLSLFECYYKCLYKAKNVTDLNVLPWKLSGNTILFLFTTNRGDKERRKNFGGCNLSQNVH